MMGADSCRAIRCVSTLALLSQRIGLPNGLLEATLAWLVCLAERLLPSDSLAALARWVGVPTAVSPQGRCPLGEVPPCLPSPPALVPVTDTERAACT